MGQAGETPSPSASTAACDDDQIDAYSSGLHVQASTALRYVARLHPALYLSRYKQAPAYTLLFLSEEVVAETSAFPNSLFISTLIPT